MTDQFVKYDGTQWTLGQGVPGPRGPAGLQGPEGPPGTSDGHTTVVQGGGVTTPGTHTIDAHQVSALHFTLSWTVGTYVFQLGNDGQGFTFGNIFLDMSSGSFTAGTTFTFQLGTVGATTSVDPSTSPYFMLLWNGAGYYSSVPLAASGGTGPGGLIVDADVSPSAAIQGTKIIPSFGSQEVITKSNMLATSYDLYPIRIPIDSNTDICWTFDETSLPFHNSGNAGTQSLTVTPFNPSIFTTGLFNGGFNMSAELATDSIDTPLMLNTVAATLSCWVKLTNLSGGPIVAKKYDTSGTHTTPFDALAIYLDPANSGQPLFRITIAGGNFDVLTSTVLTTGTWHHLGCSWDGTNFNCYIDGAPAGINPFGSGSTPIDFGSNGPWFLGQFVSGDGIVDLIVDDVRAESIARPPTYFSDVYFSAIFPGVATSSRPGDIEMNGDIGGSPLAPTVVGIQGIPLKVQAPSNGQVLTYVSSENKWEPAGGGGGFSSNYFSNFVPGTIGFTGVQGKNQNSSPHSAIGDCVWVGTLTLAGSGNIFCSFSANTTPGGYNGLTYAITLLSGAYTVNGTLPSPGILTGILGANIGLATVTDYQFIRAYSSSTPLTTTGSTIIIPSGFTAGTRVSVVVQVWDIDGDPSYNLTVQANYGSFIIAEI